MLRIASLLVASVALLVAAPANSSEKTPSRLKVVPQAPLMFGQGAEQRLVAIAEYSDGSSRDVTAEVRFSSAKPGVATVNASGIVTALTGGVATIQAEYGGLWGKATALIQRADKPLRPSFMADVMPVVTRIGCNGGNCHGSLNGQNGFKLSLFGYEPKDDYEMITCEENSRRINLDEPEKSLLLTKPTFEVAHGGGQVLQKDSPEYRVLLNWIRAGAKRNPQERRIASIRIEPDSLVLYGKESKRQLLVTARYSDGTEADVTRGVKFESNDDSIAEVTPDGVVTGIRGGETAVVARGPGLVTVVKIGVVPEIRTISEIEPSNFIDIHVFEKLKRLSIPPAGPADDATFLRRAYLDTIGIIPSSDEVRDYLADRDPEKRAKLVNELLNRPEYADYWSLYWGDHLGNTKQLLYNKGPYTFTRWLYNAFRENQPYDEFVKGLITSSGNMYDGDPAGSYYPLMKKELDMASITSQLFLGIKIECARCHNHPLEKWTQDDFNGMAAFFSQVRYKGAGPRNNERMLYVNFEREFVHPDTGKVYQPKALGGPVMKTDEWSDRREQLADWLTQPDNPYFAKAMVNRVWRNFMGRGLVEPIDDFRATNPATNEPLLNALAQDFIDHDYDIHHLIRVITASKAYQRSSVTNEANRADTTAYSYYYPRRMIAEQLADSVAQATGVAEEFRYLYPGTRATQLPEPEIPSYMLDVFDRPSRQLICERTQTNTLNQALHLISGDTVQRKVVDEQGVLRELLAQGRDSDTIVEEIYLRTVSRYPDDEERGLARNAITKAGDTDRGLEDVFWALLNSKEFLYNH